MIATLMIAAALAAQEAELEARMPAVLEQCAAQYRALDKAATPLRKDTNWKPEKTPHGAKPNGDLRTPHGWDRKSGKLDMRSIYWWTSGHFPGSLWYLHELTGADDLKARAKDWTEILAPNSKVDDNHDVGFIMYCSFGNARRILKSDAYDDLLVETAHSLCRRYNEKLGLIRSWGPLDGKNDFLVIPDNLMNLELLCCASATCRAKGDKANADRFLKIAMSHADVTMKHHFRPDGGCRHVLDYDQATGRVKGIMRGQGASCETAWSRGQSWAIYGYTMMYRQTGFRRYLDFAMKLADYAMNHPNMPEDGIPYWDYGAPGEERDTSAGAVMASALLELSRYVGEADRVRYRAFAVKQIAALASPAYLAKIGENGNFLLLHGVGHKPAGSEVDVPLDYGDYYFLEALVRFRDLRAEEAKLASLAAKLPRKAALPADEHPFRFFVPSWSLGQPKSLTAEAEKALAAPLPTAPDALYEEYWANGNRSHFQDARNTCVQVLELLTLAEVAEGKGRFVRKIEESIGSICDMKSWVLPAHDWTDGDRGTFRGTCPSVDLGCSAFGAIFATVVQLVGDRLDPKVVRRLKDECEKRVFAPVRRELRIRRGLGCDWRACANIFLWWMDGNNNWNAVCWDNMVCAALGLIDDPVDRARFVDAADRAIDVYLKYGFEEDGYCSEGMGYWNYGFGHHLQMGRLLRRISDGKIDVFTRPKQRLAAAYARAYTLQEGCSPAFADGCGGASKTYLKLVDEFWPDLPKTLPPTSEFPAGQVWLFRGADGFSVAVKGGHNGEHHNHNDLGSYYVTDGTVQLAGDPGSEVYTRRTFSPQRYESKIINSYGHPVPVIGGLLQATGREFRAEVLKSGYADGKGFVELELKGAYDTKDILSFVRRFDYDGKAKTFAVTDRFRFAKPLTLEEAYVTDVKTPVDVKVEVVKGGGYTTREEDIENPERFSPHRTAIVLKKPVTEAEVHLILRGI